MNEKQQKKVTLVLVMAVLILVGPPIFKLVVSDLMEPSVEEARQKMKNYLYEKYGKEFVVDRIGTRSSRGEEFFQARIYPKEIVGTNKEGDDYYYASATVGKKSFGRLGDVGDSYGLTMINIGAEEYLLPKAKEIFGERVQLKTEVKYRIQNSTGFYEWNKESDFLKALEEVRSNPDKRRIELELDIYVFDRIKNKQEKEERRKDIFEFVQYLKKEGLYEYLELGITFIDERVLAPSYNDFASEVRFSDKVEKKHNDETVKMPSMKLREKMSRKLQSEIDKMSEEEVLKSMNKIRKDELTYDNLREYNGQYYCWIYSIGMLKENYSSSITEEDKETTHDKLEDIELSRYKKYIYIN